MARWYPPNSERKLTIRVVAADDCGYAPVDDGSAVVLTPGGDYLQVQGVELALLRLACEQSNGTTSQDVCQALRLSPGEVSIALEALLAAGLLREQVEGNAEQPPPIRFVLTIVIWNWWYQVALRVHGWRLVATRTTLRPSIRTEVDAIMLTNAQFRLQETVLAAARHALCFPGVTPSCIPMALSIWRLARRLTPDAAIHIGCHFVPSFEAHAWVEAGGTVLDPALDRVSVTPFSSQLQMAGVKPPSRWV